jgi:hypothetical protein
MVRGYAADLCYDECRHGLELNSSCNFIINNLNLNLYTFSMFQIERYVSQCNLFSVSVTFKLLMYLSNQPGIDPSSLT